MKNGSYVSYTLHLPIFATMVQLTRSNVFGSLSVRCSYVEDGCDCLACLVKASQTTILFEMTTVGRGQMYMLYYIVLISLILEIELGVSLTSLCWQFFPYAAY